MNSYTPEAAQQKYPGAPQNQPRYPWRASGKAQPKPQQNTGGQQEAAPGPQKAPDMSMYSPGQAKPIQPQSQGTPYGAQSDGNYAYATPNNRPAPFTQRYTNFDGTQSEQPNFGQRDAFIQNINDSMLPYYGGKSQGAPQFDFQSMYKKAGDMVKDGWQNPFSMPAQPQQPSLEQQLSQYAPQPQYQPAPSQPAQGDLGMNDALGGDLSAWFKSGGSASPVSPTAADPYAQFRPDDSGMLYRPAASPPAFDPLYGHGTTAAWAAAGAPKSAPQFAGIFAKGYTPQPGETDVIQPGTARPQPMWQMLDPAAWEQLNPGQPYRPGSQMPGWL